MVLKDKRDHCFFLYLIWDRISRRSNLMYVVVWSLPKIFKFIQFKVTKMKHAWFPVNLSFVLTHSSDRFNGVWRVRKHETQCYRESCVFHFSHFELYFALHSCVLSTFQQHSLLFPTIIYVHTYIIILLDVLVCSFTRCHVLTSVKGRLSKNTHRFYTPKHLVSNLLCNCFILCTFLIRQEKLSR